MTRRIVTTYELMMRQRKLIELEKARRLEANRLIWRYDEATISDKTNKAKTARYTLGGKAWSILILGNLNAQVGYYRVLDHPINEQTLEEKVSFCKKVMEREGITEFGCDDRPLTRRLTQIGGIVLAKKYTLPIERRLTLKNTVYHWILRIQSMGIKPIRKTLVAKYIETFTNLGWRMV